MLVYLEHPLILQYFWEDDVGWFLSSTFKADDIAGEAYVRLS